MRGSRVPLYLGAEWYGQLSPILDYKDWDTMDIPDPVENDISGMLWLRVSQDFPMRLPMHRAFYAADSINLLGEAFLENHYPLYLEDREK